MPSSLSRLLSTSALFLTTAAFAQKAPIQITADLSDAPRKLYHAEVDIPVQPGPVSLTTPKWIPGNHRPTGPVDEITGVVFTANGRSPPLASRRRRPLRVPRHRPRRSHHPPRPSRLHRHRAR